MPREAKTAKLEQNAIRALRNFKVMENPLGYSSTAGQAFRALGCRLPWIPTAPAIPHRTARQGTERVDRKTRTGLRYGPGTPRFSSRARDTGLPANDDLELPVRGLGVPKGC